MVYSVDDQGFIHERDEPLDDIPITQGDVITVSLNTLFLKYINEIGAKSKGGEVLVYTEVHDSPNENNPYRTVVYNEAGTSANSILGVTDRVIYGPVQYKGYPLRIQLVVVELDKEDNEMAQRVMQTIGDVISTAAPSSVPVVGPAVQLGKLLTVFNEDDYELRADITLHPVTAAPTKKKTATASEKLTGIVPTWLLPKRVNIEKGPPPKAVKKEGKYRLIARKGRPCSMVNMPIRQGRTLIVKAESEGRKWSDDLSQMRDYLAADRFVYGGVDSKVLVLAGGYLWLDTVSSAAENTKKAEEDAKKNKAKNKVKKKIKGTVDNTELYAEKTYAVLSVRRGGVEGNEAMMRKVSEDLFKPIVAMLQAPMREQFDQQIKQFSSVLSASIRAKQLVNSTNQRVGMDASFRSNPSFVLSYIDALVTKEPGDKKDSTEELYAKTLYAKSLNAQLLTMINSSVLGFPASAYTDSANWERLKDIKLKAKKAIIWNGEKKFFVWTDPPKDPSKDPPHKNLRRRKGLVLTGFAGVIAVRP
jgi:hypothetical protein